MTEGLVFTSRLSGRRLLGAEGLAVGRVRDVVLLQASRGEPPRALGLVGPVQRRNIFVSLGRIAEMSVDGVRLAGSSVDLGRFSQRTGEILASSLYHKPAGAGTVLDVGISRSGKGRGGWEVSVLAVGQRRGLLRQAGAVVPWDQYPGLFQPAGAGEQIAGLRDMNPTDLATAVGSMPAAGKHQLADALHDEELADVLQEMPEQDQVGFLAGLGHERIADVIEEMEPDDAADLLAEMPAGEREQLLAAMPAPSASSGCCASRRPSRWASASRRAASCGPACLNGRSRQGSPPTTWWPWPSATRRAACSGR